MRAAYRLLDSAQQERLRGLRAANSYNNGGVFPPRVPAQGEYEQLVDVVHPVVRAHPVTGEPALYLDLDRATHIESLPVDEGRALLRTLQDFAEDRGRATRTAGIHMTSSSGTTCRSNTKRAATSPSANRATSGGT